MTGKDFFDIVKDFIVNFGWTKGVFTIFFFLSHYWLYKSNERRVREKQNEIDRLAQDNREYRTVYLKQLDAGFNYTKKKGKIS